MNKRILIGVLTLGIFGALCLLFREDDSQKRTLDSSENDGLTSHIDSKKRRLVREPQEKEIVFPVTLESNVIVAIENESDFSDFSDNELINTFESAYGLDWLKTLDEMKRRFSREIVRTMLLNIDQRRAIHKASGATPCIPELQYPVALALEEGDSEVNEQLTQFITSNAELEKRILGARLILKIDPQKLSRAKDSMNDDDSKRFDKVLALASSKDVLNRMFPIEVPER